MEIDSVIGVDEVGRGCLAGPVVAGAILWKSYPSFDGLNDSKKLTLKQREDLFQKFKDFGLIFATGSVDINEIEERNILCATRLAMERAVFEVLERIKTKYLSFPNPDIVLIDGKAYPNGYLQNIPLDQKWIIKGDTKEPSIMAASVIAKVLRDRYIKSLVDQFPEYEKYGWRTNVGYGTKKHFKAIKKYGLTPFHRKTFEPIKMWLKEGIIK